MEEKSRGRKRNPNRATNSGGREDAPGTTARTKAGNVRMTAEESLAKAQSVIRGIVANRHDRPSLVADIACEVGAEIIEGRIRSGDDLNTVELARRYDSSRTPVREALMLLENEGLVDIMPRKRPRAKAYSIDEVREIYRMRAVLLDFVASEVATLASEEDIAQLRAILDCMRKAAKRHDVSAFTWASVDFHDCNNRISQNSTVTRILNSLLLRTLPMRRLNLSQPGRMEETLEDHLHIVDAFVRHDSRLAAAIIRANHTSALARIEGYIKTTGSLAP